MSRQVSLRFLIISLALLLSMPAWASDRDQRPSFSITPNAHTHVGSSPFPPPDADDTRFVVDTGSGLDTGCTYRSGGPLQIKVPIKRYVGPVDGFGNLIDPVNLKVRGLISPFAKLVIPAFDIDINGAPGVPPEVDLVRFNGHDLGQLTGGNNVWKRNEFPIPIEWIHFPQASLGGPQMDEPSGVEPTPKDNTVTILIDQASGNSQNWCMAVDWAQIEFSAIAPVFLVHGIAAQSSTWDAGFVQYLENTGMPVGKKINLEANGSVATNAGILAGRLSSYVRSFGAKKAHIIAHSKGGLDTRYYSNHQYNSQNEFKLLSVSTLSTPHHGAVLADILDAARNTEDPQSSDPDIDRLIYWNWTFPPQDPGLQNLRIARAANFNSGNPLRTDIRWWGWGANADANGNGTIDVPAETDGMIPGAVPDAIVRKVANSAYNILAYVETVNVTAQTSAWGLNHYTTVEQGTRYGFRVPNDMAVNTLSAMPPPGGSFMGSFQANHSTIKSSQAAQSVLIQILNQFPNP